MSQAFSNFLSNVFMLENHFEIIVLKLTEPRNAFSGGVFLAQPPKVMYFQKPSAKRDCP